jgi:hypothetical protein
MILHQDVYASTTPPGARDTRHSLRRWGWADRLAHASSLCGFAEALLDSRGSRNSRRDGRTRRHTAARCVPDRGADAPDHGRSACRGCSRAPHSRLGVSLGTTRSALVAGSVSRRFVTRRVADAWFTGASISPCPTTMRVVTGWRLPACNPEFRRISMEEPIDNKSTRGPSRKTSPSSEHR